MAFAVAMPTRSALKLPGPMPTPTALTSSMERAILLSNPSTCTRSRRVCSCPATHVVSASTCLSYKLTLATVVAERPLPLGAAVGHGATAVSDKKEPVENEDVATFVATFASGSVGTFSATRVAHGLPNSLGFELFGSGGAASFDLARAGEFQFSDNTSSPATSGYRRVLIGPEHPYITRGLPMDFPGVNYGQNDLFTFETRAFLEQIAGVGSLPRVPDFAHGLRNLRLLDAVVRSSQSGGASVDVR